MIDRLQRIQLKKVGKVKTLPEKNKITKNKGDYYMKSKKYTPWSIYCKFTVNQLIRLFLENSPDQKNQWKNNTIPSLILKCTFFFKWEQSEQALGYSWKASTELHSVE